jgi:hypothetical protein
MCPRWNAVEAKLDQRNQRGHFHGEDTYPSNINNAFFLVSTAVPLLGRLRLSICR